MAPRFPRLSVAGLLGIVLSFGVGFAALRAATQPWADALNVLMAVLLSTSILCPLVGRGKVFWTGFAVLGWSYIAFYITHKIYCSFNEFNALYPMDSLLSILYMRLHRARPLDDGFAAFQNIRHCLSCVVYALLGRCCHPPSLRAVRVFPPLTPTKSRRARYCGPQ